MVTYLQIFQKSNLVLNRPIKKKANEAQSKLFIFLETASYKRQGINSVK